MYVEFRIPNGITGPTALLLLRRDLVEWSQRHAKSYTEKTVKQTHRVCFTATEDYTFFLLTWNPAYARLPFTVINIP